MAEEADKPVPASPRKRPNPEKPDDRRERQAAERRRAAAWIQEKWTNNTTCQVCGINNWTVTEAIEVRGFNGGSLIVGAGSGVFPMFQAVCSNCGHTLFFNAAIAKVVEGP